MDKLFGIFFSVPFYSFALLILGSSITAGLFAFHVAVVPLIFKYSKNFRRNLVFANFVQWPLNIDFEDPSASGVEGGRNLSIDYYSKVDRCRVKIGIWHILPKTVYEKLKGRFGDKTDKEELNRLMDEELANSKTPIMLYCHGNSNSRAASHRVELYKFFQQMEYHTIAFDYRGYGDSTNLRPSEQGVVEDSLLVYEWIVSTIEKGETKPAVFVWGHSLGTGISSHLLGNLDDLTCLLLDRLSSLPLPKGLILEAPFNNLADEVAHHPLSKLVSWLPYFESTFVAPFRSEDSDIEYWEHLELKKDSEFTFKSDLYLASTPSLPILMFHAKDDLIVPFDVGVKLFRCIVSSRISTDADVMFHAYEKDCRLGHKDICYAPNLGDIVDEFVKKHQGRVVVPRR